MLDFGATYTIQTGVWANSAVTGATQMRFDGGAGYGAWMPYQAQYPIWLTPGDGLKTSYAQYKDDAGNTLTLTDTIILDTAAPAGTFTLNGGASSTTTTAVTANMSVTGAATMSFDTGSGFGAWLPYASTTALTLPSGDGTKTVQAQFKDAIGNTMSAVATIVLATPAPVPAPAPAPAPPSALSAGAGRRQVTLRWAPESGVTFRVWRATSVSGPFATIVSGLAGTSFVNSSLSSRQTYYYYLTAVDSRGVQSARSAMVSARTLRW